LAAAGVSRTQTETGSPSEKIDYRVVALGALIPDLFDKALSSCPLRGVSRRNDHLLGHTLLFNLHTLLWGLVIARKGDSRLVIAALAALTHILIDPVIRVPRTLFWPLLGREFPRFGGWGRPLNVASQALSALVFFLVGYKLWKEGRLCRFLGTGRM